MVDGRQAGDVADELVEQRRLQQVRLLRDERLLGQHHLLGGGRVGRQQAPVDEAAVAQVRVVRVLGGQAENLRTGSDGGSGVARLRTYRQGATEGQGWSD